MSTFGFRGEALSSLAEIAVLDITSRSPSSSHAFVKTVSGSDVLERGDAVREPGTTITVRDLFHSLPVRRQQTLETIVKETDAVRKRLEKLLLLRNDVQLTLFDQASGTRFQMLSRLE